MRNADIIKLYSVDTGRQAGTVIGTSWKDADGCRHVPPDDSFTAPYPPKYRDWDGNLVADLALHYCVWVDGKRRPIVPQPQRAFPEPTTAS